ncbi:superoxide dismutase [Ruegeria lacuscaerulensis]|uniref:superoxide dismutase n=1 Tax=Ruegeria lacuscaerulensis TaxID=55218 RepID=UPI0014808616|nr:superoxide dismutase [Ruegeria lacuscaerulensis]
MTLSRRGFLASAGSGLLVAATPALARSVSAGEAYSLPSLDYSYYALEPVIGAETMELHHSKHAAGYARNLNKLIPGTSLEGQSLESIIKTAAADRGKYQTVLNSAGQHWNHSEFWKMLVPGGTGVPGALKKKIEGDFGSFEAFREQFINVSSKQFGSGWGWLAVDTSGKLVVLSTPNGENPLVHDMFPLLGVDVWEHAYYVDYRNRRKEYIAAVVDGIVNWEYVDARLSNA